MRIKKTSLVLISIVFVLVGWNSYRNEIELDVPNVCSYDVPTVSEKTGALWYRKFSDNYFMGTSMTSSPIVTEKNIYVVNRDILYELNMNGGIERKLTLYARMNSTCHPVLAYGKLYIPLMNARVECVDTSDFSVVFSVCTCDDEKNSFQSLCPVLYHNGYIYSGVWAAKSGGQIDTKAVSSGYFYCLDASDGHVVWKYGQDGSSSGFYWNSAVVCGDKLCFISEGGRVIVHGLTDEKTYDTFELTDGEQIRCGLCQDMTGGSIFTVSKKGILYKFSVDTSGKISKQKSVRLIESAKSISATSTPTVYAGKLYIGCFADGYGYLCVRSAADLSVICDAQGEKGSEIKCPPVVVDKTETGAEEDIYVYFTSNDPTGSLYMMHDGRISKFFEPQRNKQYCIACVSVGYDGTLYYSNDSGTLFALNYTDVSADRQTVKVPKDFKSKVKYKKKTYYVKKKNTKNGKYYKIKKTKRIPTSVNFTWKKPEKCYKTEAWLGTSKKNMTLYKTKSGEKLTVSLKKYKGKKIYVKLRSKYGYNGDELFSEYTKILKVSA